MGIFKEAENVKRSITNILYLSDSIANVNARAYNSEILLQAYSSYVGLKKPEQTILSLLKTKLPISIMLDVGVGASRTTEYFSVISKRYIRIDYSENMINYCRSRFKEVLNVSFEIKDARNLLPIKMIFLT
jgi:ubiquinone/menaquinone biosynthesis C-methylase UbiE